MRADYLRTVAEAALHDIEVVDGKGFGEMALTMVPDSLLQTMESAGVDVRAVARTVRSVTVRAWKPPHPDASRG
jgi:hypothetical protein